MSLVISQTLPYTPDELQLLDPKRWSRLFPLMRPSVKIVETPNGHPIIIDTALANSREVLVAAIGRKGNLSSQIWNKDRLAAFSIEPFGVQEAKIDTVLASDVVKVLKENGFPTANGVVIVRAARLHELRAFDGGLEVDFDNKTKMDHALSLLRAVNAETRASLEKTKTLFEHFMKSGTGTSSTFLEKKTGNSPSVDHACDVVEFKSAKKSVDRDLGVLLSSSPNRKTDVIYSVHYSDTNGLSKLENNILAHEISQHLAEKNLPSYITQSTIQEPHWHDRGWAISLCAIPNNYLTAQSTSSNTLASSSSSVHTTKPKEGLSKIQFSDSQVRKIITAGCESVIKDEPTITEYDTIVGDGDCGYTLRDGAKQVLHFISTADLSTLPSTLSALVDDLELNMGGTSGALYCIFLSSLAQELWTAPTFADALKGALEHLLKYTRARLGDRTCLDCLIPFVETFKSTGDVDKALRNAEKGVESTTKLEAKLGRSSYLDDAVTRGVPDPGAYGLLKLLEGMVSSR